MLSVPVPVKITVEPEAGTAFDGFAMVVISLLTQKKVEELVKAGEMPVMVDVPPESVAMPAIECPVAPRLVFAQAPAAAIVPQV
jgi:hypothetical protein